MAPGVSGSFPTEATAAVASQVVWGSATASYVLGMGGTVTATGLTLTIAPCQAFALETTLPARLQGFYEAGVRTLTVPAADGTYWLLGRALTTVTPAGWTPLPGVHYLWRQSAAVPAPVAGTVLLATVVVSGGVVTQVWDAATRVITAPVAVPAGYASGPHSRLIVQEQGRLRVGSGQTLALRGPVEAGRWPIFDLSAGGTVTFPSGGTVKPEWWGARADDQTPSAAAITAALNANPTAMDVDLGGGVYRLESAIRSPQAGSTLLEAGSRLRGLGMEMTCLRRATDYTGVLLNLNADLTNTAFLTRFTLSDFVLDGIDRAAGTIGLESGVYGESTVSRVRIRQCETGWHSPGTLVTVWCEQLSLWENGNGFLHNSMSGRSNGISAVHFQGGRWRNNTLNAFYLKNSPDPAVGQRSRTISFDGVVFEGTQVPSGTNVAVRLEQAETISFRGVHFEQHAPHVHISGTGQTFPSRHITFVNCNFGNVHAAAPDPKIAFQWDGDLYQGAGSWVESSLIGGTGEWRINHAGTVFQVRNVTLGAVTLFGNYVSDYPRLQVPHLVTRGNLTTSQWFQRRLEKPWGTAAVLHLDERVFSATTTDATPTAIAVYSEEVGLPDGATLLVVVEVVARQQNNSAQGAWGKVGLFKNVGGAITQVGGTQDLYPEIESVDALQVTLNAGTLVEAARVIVTGLAEASPIDWYGTIRTARVMAPTAP